MKQNQFWKQAEDGNLSSSKLNSLSSKMATTNLSPNTLHATIIFKYKRHSAIICEKLLSFFKENELFDTVLIAAGKKCARIQAHRVVLCALSEYFFNIFRGTQKISKENVVELKDIEASTLEPVINFMYNGFIDFNIETIEAILRTALFLKMEQLVDGCCETIGKCINSDNFLKWYQLANELDLSELKEKCLEGIFNHFKQISKNKVRFNEIYLNDILYNNNEVNEKDVFSSMVNWINFDKKSRGHMVPDLLPMVLYKKLTPEFIIANRKYICKTVGSYELTDTWLEWHLSDPIDRLDKEDYRTSFLRKNLDKLAAIGVRDTDIIITTLNFRENEWSTKLRIRIPHEKSDSKIIVIDGKLIAVGGYNKNKNENDKSVECLDLETLEWTVLPPMKKTETIRQLADLNGYLCVLGSHCRGFGFVFDEASGSIEIYDFSTRKWNDVQPLCPISAICQIASHNGILYIVDLKNGFLQSYQVSSNKWTSKEIEKDPCLWNFGFAATEKFLYVYGGYYFIYDDQEYIHKVTRYDLLNNSHCEMAPFLFPRFCIESIVLKDCLIICDSDHVDYYNFETDKWDTLGDLSKKNWSSSTLACLN